MAKDNINQELTRQNIYNLRKKYGYTQAKVAELMGGSRTIYNGIENGKVKITEYYVQTLADVYGVPFESIAVFASGYDEGFYQGMRTRQKLDESQFDNDSMKVYHMGKELLTGKKYTSTLYPAIKALGYAIEVVDIKDLDSAKIPQEVKDNIPDGKVFVIMKGIKTVGYVAPSNYYNFEQFLNTAINGYLGEIHDSYLKADKNPPSFKISYTRSGTGVKRLKTSGHTGLFKPTVQGEGLKTFKLGSRRDKYSAEMQMKQLQEDMRTHGIQDMNDDDGDED
ncbi:MAG: helix-turn-helix transcriptional regulator [Ruminococcus sp.]|nr:helix-turn-helix transcriptional regulator [Ruminococcus sp.]